MSIVLEGGCYCGEVRWRATARPVNTMVCHCQSCRRVAAAPVVAWLTFEAPRFAWEKGRATAFRSSPGVQRTFCAACGTPLTCEREEDAGYIDVTTCSADRPDAYPPTHHSWLSHDVAWVKFGDGLPAFRRSRFGGDG